MIEIIVIALELLTPAKPPTEVKVGSASTFYPVEKGMNNGKFACGGDWEDPNAPVCATRAPTEETWGIPCGAWIQIENVDTGDKAWCKVMDRGPYGKIDEDGNWFNAAVDRKEAAKDDSREPRKGVHRGVLDMSKSVSKKLKSKGRVKVKIRWWKKNKFRKTLDTAFFGEDIYKKRRPPTKK